MHNNIIFYGPPGTGKTYHAKKAAVQVIYEANRENVTIEEKIYYNEKNFHEGSFAYALEKYDSHILIISLHEGMTPSDLLIGISVEASNGNAVFLETEKAVVQLIEKIYETKKPGVLILDDIHRVDLSSVIGELLYGFLHRNEPITLSSGRSIIVPEELYVFMTMNSFHAENGFDKILLKKFEASGMMVGTLPAL